MIRRSLSFAIGMLFLLFAVTVAAESRLKPGDYIQEGGVSTLEIRKDEKGIVRFSISAVGVNAHSCELSGIIEGRKAILKEDSDENICEVNFTPDKKGIEVMDEAVAGVGCRYYCGARASFDGHYLVPARGCDTESLSTTRQKFKRLYDKKQYAQAKVVLEPVLKKCRATLNSLYEEGDIRNDLAVTYHKLGDATACKAVLAPYIEDAAKKDGDIDTYTYAPSDQSTYMATIHAVRVNLGLCEKLPKAAGDKP